MPRQDPQAVRRDVARRLGEVRRKKGWTQEISAERLRVSLKYMQKLESGAVNLDVLDTDGFRGGFHGRDLRLHLGEGRERQAKGYH